MTKTLDVYFHGNLAGELIQDQYGEIGFTYANSWLENPSAIRISCSLPLQKETFTKKICGAFFNGLLPEEQSRKLIAKNLGISGNNDFSMLEKIGGECAGALSFVKTGNKLDIQDNQYLELNDTQLLKILRELPTRPLLAGDEGIRLSLAGVQDKLAVYVYQGQISIPTGNAPSTHILKPDFNLQEGVIFNEAFCLQLAKKIGLSTADAEIKTIEDISYLLVKRYDRLEKTPGQIERMHQEDFCQALGVPSIKKYQHEGGPSLKQCIDLIKNESSTPVIEFNNIINAIIFNFLIGNCDAHGKNFSLLYPNGNTTKLAPLYDLICTIYYKDLTPKMAMKLGGEYRINHINIEHFNRFAEEIGAAKTELRRRIKELIEQILTAIPGIEKVHDTQVNIAKLIHNRCENFAEQIR